MASWARVLRSRWVRRVALAAGGLVVLLVGLRVATWFLRERWTGAPATSVDTVLQDPAEWTYRLLEVEGFVVPGSFAGGAFGCRYRLEEGFQSLRVEGRLCEGIDARAGRLARVVGTLRREGSELVLEQEVALWNFENFDHVRYMPPVIAKGVDQAVVRGRAEDFRRRVAERAPGASKPDDIHVLRKAFMHGCFLRYDGVVGCWHNHQWDRERQGQPSELIWVHDAPTLTTLDLDYYSGVGLSEAGEVYWFSAPRTDGLERNVPQASPGQAVRVEVPKAVSVRAGNGACAVLETGGVACWSGTEPPKVRPARVPHLERLAGGCEVGRDEIVCSKERIPRAGLSAFVESDGTLYGHLCLLRDGVVSCRGSNWFTELGVPRFRSEGQRDFETWIPVATSEPVVEVAAGGRHTCVQLASGWVECWGANENGQASPFEPWMSSHRPLRVARFPLDWELSAYTDMTCASRGGAFECWGFCQHLPKLPGVVCTTWPDKP